MKSKKKKCNNSLKEQEKNEVPKYDKAKWKNIIDTTQSNYANMIKRLDKSQKMSNFVLNYICLFDYLFISSQMSAKPYFIGSTGILLLW